MDMLKCLWGQMVCSNMLHTGYLSAPWLYKYHYKYTMYVYHSMELFNRRDEITPLGLNGYVEMVLWGQMVMF
jgi:hypothetical protein